MNRTAHFQQLLTTAAAQPQPQRLLFVFAVAELPSGSTPEQTEQFAKGQGGSLAPLMCVDKSPKDLADFSALVTESHQAGPDWQVVFAASLAGKTGRPPTQTDIDQTLQTMVESVRTGHISNFAAYDPQGAFLDIA